MRTRASWVLASVMGLTILSGCGSAPQRTAEAPRPRAPQIVATPEPPPPPAIASELIAMETAPANRFVRAAEPGEIVLRLRLDGRTLKNAERPPINLALVVDTSGSMEGKGIEDARAASLALLDSLSPGDRLAVIAFHSQADVLVPSTILDKKSLARIRAQIGAMKANGTTDLAGGLEAGLREVQKSFQAAGVNRVVLLGDGVPNDESRLLPLAQMAGQHAIPVTMLGLGLDYNETVMTMVAQHSGGKYHDVRDSSLVASVFKDEVVRLKRVVGRNASLRLTPGPGVTIKSVVGLPSSAAGAATHVALGDMSEGDQRDIIVRLSAAGRRAGSVVELMDTALSFDDAQGSRLEERNFISVRATESQDELSSGRDEDVERSAARVMVADMIVRAIALARAGNMPAAQMLLDMAEKEAKKAARLFADAELEEKAKSIGPLRQSLPTLARQPEPASPAVAQLKPTTVGPMRMPTNAPGLPAPAAAAEIVMDAQASAVRTLQGY